MFIKHYRHRHHRKFFSGRKVLGWSTCVVRQKNTVCGFCFYDNNISISMTTYHHSNRHCITPLLFIVFSPWAPTEGCLPSYFVWMSLIMVMSPLSLLNLTAVEQGGCGCMTWSYWLPEKERQWRHQQLSEKLRDFQLEIRNQKSWFCWCLSFFSDNFHRNSTDYDPFSAPYE